MLIGRIKIRLPILLSILSLLFCVNLSFVSGSTLIVIRLSIIIMDALVVIYENRRNLRIKNLEMWGYAITIMISGFVNNRKDGLLFQVILYSMMLLMSYLIIGCAQIKYGEESFQNTLCKVLIIIMVIVDFLIILRGGVGTYINGRTDMFFYIGSKFVVSYFNMLLLALLMRKFFQKPKIFFICIAGGMIFVSYIIDCMTGVTGIMVMMVIYIFNDKIEKVLKKPWVVTGTVVLSGIFVLLLQFVVGLYPVQFFLTKVVNTDLELTGRADIFAILSKLLFVKPVWGYGYGNTAVRDFLGYGNPQNGLFDIGISYGFVGICTFLILVFTVVKSREKSENKGMFAILIFIYAMIVCGTVEINFSILMIIALSIYKNRRKRV